MLKKFFKSRFGTVSTIVLSMALLVGAGKILYGERLNLGTSISFQQGTVVPTTTATTAEAGSLYFNTTTGTIYRKTDAGSSTNWSIIGTSAAITAPTAYTPTFAGATPTGVDFKYMQLGNGYLIWGEFVAGSVSGTTFSFSTPNSGVINNLTASNSFLGHLASPAAPGYLRMSVLGKNGDAVLTVGAAADNSASALTSLAGNAAFSNSQRVSITPFYVPITGLASVVNTATTPIITGWTSWTPTFANLGTVTGITSRYRQVGDGIEFESTWTTGTNVGSTASMTLPTVCTTASNYPTLQVVGVLTRSASNGAFSDYVLAEASSGFLYFGLQFASASGLSKVAGTAYSNSTVLSAKGFVRCAGMPGVIPAPNLVGFATNNGSSAIRIEAATLAAPSAGACAVTEVGGSDWINGNATSGATGACTVTFNAGIWSSAPICVCISTSSGAAFCGAGAPATTSTFTTSTVTHAGADSNQDRQMICMGAR
jgi:hypothetical protein